MAERKLDLFKTLSQISKKNITYYDSLTEQEIKEFVPFVIQRWLSGTTNKQQIYLLNEIVNQHIFNLGTQYKDLLFYLLSIACSGKTQKYSWNKLPTKSQTSKPTSLGIVCEYYKYSYKEGKEALALLTHEDVIWCGEQLGKQDEEITKVYKEWGIKNVKKTNDKSNRSEDDTHTRSSNALDDIFQD